MCGVGSVWSVSVGSGECVECECVEWGVCGVCGVEWSVWSGKINIYCKCRTQEGGNMIACSGWDEWFHEECVTASRQVWKKKKSDWYCDNCKI